MEFGVYRYDSNMGWPLATALTQDHIAGSIVTSKTEFITR